MAMLQQAAAAAPTPPPEAMPQAMPPAAAPAPAPVEQAAPAPDEVTADAGASGPGPKEEPATPEEQAEYERAVKALETVMYGNDQISRAIVDQLNAENKIDSVVKASLLLLKQLDEKLNFDQVIIPQLVQEIADRVVEMAERVKDIEFSDKDIQAVIGATWEGAMAIYGVEESDYAELTAGMTDADKQGYQGQYNKFLGES